MSIAPRALSFFFVLSLFACDTGGGTDDAGPLPDQDAGPVADAGPDTGVDGGAVDAGVDAGTDGGPGGGGDAGVVGLGDPCAPVNPDPCLVHDLMCSGGHCVLPEEMSCTTTNDCFDPTAVCVPVQTRHSCVPDFCGPGTSNGVLYGPCDNQGTGDGTCLPGIGGDFGLCLIHGTAPLGSGCGDRTTALQQLCGAGALCAGVEGGLLALCAPICDPSSAAAPTCPSGFTCFKGPTLIELDYGLQVGAGYCLQDCGAGQPCPGQLQCANFSDSTGPHDECLPHP